MMHESIGSTAVTTTTTTTTALLANHQRPVDDPIQKSSSSPTSSRRQIARIDSVCSASPIPVDTIAIAASVTSTANGFGKMQLCSCFAHVPSERHRDVKAWLEGTPWHIPNTSSNGNSISNSNSISSSTSSSNDISNNNNNSSNNNNHALLSPLPVRRCLDGCGGCILVSVRSACRHLQELGEKPLDQLLTYMSSTVYPELCRRRRGGKAVWEGLDRLARLLRAFLEPLESRANIAYRLAHLLKDTLLGLLANAQGDVELTDELRGLLAHLEDSSLLSLKVIEHQRSLLVQLMRDVWEVKHRDFSIY